MGRSWALDDDGKANILSLRKEGLGAKKIGALTGYSRSVIQRWLRKVEVIGSEGHRRWCLSGPGAQAEQTVDLQSAKVSQKPFKVPRPYPVRQVGVPYDVSREEIAALQSEWEQPTRDLTRVSLGADANRALPCPEPWG